jgi:subtilisin family serine protease
MKRFTLILALVLMVASFTYSQNTGLFKITPELQKELDSRNAKDEMFRIIIIMDEEYDQIQMSRQIQYMNKAERRAYVIDELQRFSKDSQYNLIQLLEEGVKAGTVKELNPFWIFNGIGCVTNREMISVLSKRSDIGCIESDELRNMLPENEKPVVVTEPKRGLAWHVTQVHANDVWNLGYDGTGIVVAIIDTGVNYNHADIADHMWNGGSQYPYHGYDYVNNDNNPMDDHGHGSHCAGITAGDGTSGTQTGIAPNATIMALKVLNANGSGSSTARTNAQQFAMEHGADVVSMSLGSSGASGSRTDRLAFVNMMNAGIVASIAAGNDGEYYSSSHLDPDYNTYYAVPKNIGSPGNCPPPWHNPDQTLSGGQSAVITIGASNRNDRKSTFSSFGPVTWYGVTNYNDYRYQANSSTNIGLIKPDIIVPGTDITSLLYSNNSGYVEECGTSMATPLASGIMALMLQVNPYLTPAQIDEILETTAFPVDYRITKNNYTGAGRGDALAAIDAILTQATKPTNLSLTTCGGNVNLSWTASTAPAGYCIYRDNEQVGTTDATTFTDENVGAGKHVYYVRANDNNDRQSVHSNAVLCTIQPYATVPESLTIGWDGTIADLDWNASTVSNTLSTAELYFSDDPYTAYGGSANSTVYWGMCFNPEELRPYQGMSIDRVSIPIYTAGIAYTLRIYRGTTYGNTTGAPVYTQSFTPTSGNWAYKTMTLTTPYALTDISQDLWITFSATLGSSSGYPAVVGEYDGPSSNCFYMGDGSSVNEMCWSHVPDFGSDYNYAVCIKAHLTRTTTYTPTYNVYLDNSSEASNLSATNYSDTPALHGGDNMYYVTSKVGNNESCPSNEAKIVVVDNAQVTNSLTIDESLVYLIEDNGVLTDNGTLTCTTPDRLIINDGGQLVSSSTGVQATVKKNISPYSQTQEQNNGWNLIASPITESITPTADNGLLTNEYDLYAFNQSGTDAQGNAREWRNYEAQSFDINNKVGYLYANSGEATLTFTGTLANTATATALVYDGDARFKGFNLIGNPFPCEAYIDRSFYAMNPEGTNFIEGNGAIPPCTAVLVQAQNTSDNSVTFSKTASKTNSCIVAQLKTADIKGSNIIDQAHVNFNESDNLVKYSLDKNASSLYFPQEGNDFAAVSFAGQSVMPLNFKVKRNGSYTLSFELENADVDYLHLIDNMTGNDIDLLTNDSYTFEANVNDYASRFRLVFANCEDAVDDNETFAYINNGNIVVNQEGTLQIVDLTGRVVASRSGRIQCVPTSGMTSGVYVLRLITTDGVKTQKIVVE